MPLSEHEQRLLEQIERALYAEDPKFASTVRSTDLKSHLRRRVRRAVALLAIGLLVLVVGVALPSPPIGVAGFLVMLVAGLVVARSFARINGGEVARPAARSRARRRREPAAGSWRERIEERWRRRWEERD